MGKIEHNPITSERVLEAAERRFMTTDNPGMCVNCGASAEDVDPDAERVRCGVCGKNGVYGVDALLMRF